MKVLRASMPQVRALLCQFHVTSWLREKVAADCYHFTAWQKDRLRSVVTLLVYAKTYLEYESHREYIRHLLKMTRSIVVRIQFVLRQTSLRNSSTTTLKPILRRTGIAAETSGARIRDRAQSRWETTPTTVWKHRGSALKRWLTRS